MQFLSACSVFGRNPTDTGKGKNWQQAFVHNTAERLQGSGLPLSTQKFKSGKSRKGGHPGKSEGKSGGLIWYGSRQNETTHTWIYKCRLGKLWMTERKRDDSVQLMSYQIILGPSGVQIVCQGFSRGWGAVLQDSNLRVRTSSTWPSQNHSTCQIISEINAQEARCFLSWTK